MRTTRYKYNFLLSKRHGLGSDRSEVIAGLNVSYLALSFDRTTGNEVECTNRKEGLVIHPLNW